MNRTNSLLTFTLAILFLVALVSAATRIDLRGEKSQQTSEISKTIVSVPLKKYNIAQNSASVSGVSAGGFFAVQFQVAYSKSVVGAGIFAAGPYYCAQGSLMDAEAQCMEGFEPIQLSTLQNTISQYVSQNLIDDTSNLKRHRVFVYSGSLDFTVKTSVVQSLVSQYGSLGVLPGNVVTNFTVPSGHAWITNDYGNMCMMTMSPYINNCDLDGSYMVLNTIYGNIKPKTQAVQANLMTFDQTGNFTAFSMDSIGYLYVPTACQAGALCRIHVVFHGCQQGTSTLGTTFVSNIGMNEYAESNNIIIVYPQITTNMLNMMGCFDWINFSYVDSNYANKKGGQMTAVANILAALGSKVY